MTEGRRPSTTEQGKTRGPRRVIAVRGSRKRGLMVLRCQQGRDTERTRGRIGKIEM